MMGISIMGIREIAAHHDDRPRMSKVFSSLLLLNTITTVLSIIVLIAVTVIVPQLHANWQLLMVGAIKLLFNLFLIEWFYKGIENFKFITVRSIVVRCIYVLAIFIFVRTKDDVFFYYSSTALIIVLNAIINIIYSRKFVSFSFSGLSLRPFLGPFITLGLYTLLTSMYTTFNITYLGFARGDTEVGYYTTATKLYTILLSLYTAFTSVMLPRMSNLIANGNLTEFKHKFSQSVDGLITFSIPVIVFVLIFANRLVLLLSGPGYEGATTPMRIIIPLMFIIGYEQILVIQTLMPLQQDKTIFRNSICGAVFGVALNVILVTSMGAIGSAIVWIGAECLILVLSQIAVTKKIGTRFPIKKLLKTIAIYLPLALILYYSNELELNYILILTIGTIVSLLYFLAVNLVLYPQGIVKKLISLRSKINR